MQLGSISNLTMPLCTAKGSTISEITNIAHTLLTLFYFEKILLAQKYLQIYLALTPTEVISHRHGLQKYMP